MEHFRGQPEENFIQEALRREFPGIESSPTEQLATLYAEGLQRLNALTHDRTVDALLADARSRPLTDEEMQLLQQLTSSRAGPRKV